MKMELLPFLIQRDGGQQCFYCKRKLRLNEIKYEHLNNIRPDCRPENLVLSCQSCNVRKKFDADLQIIAKEKLVQNENGNYLSERISVESSETNTPSAEIDINITNYEITEKYLTEIIHTDGNVLYSDALNSCVYLCKKQTKHGSQQSMRNYISALTCNVGPFMITHNDDHKKIIVKRSDT